MEKTNNRIFLWDVINSTMLYIDKKRPSQLLPFRGNFPILNPAQMDLFRIACENKTYMDEIPDWAQQAIIKAQRIATIENGFKEHLLKNGILPEYMKMSGKDKAEEIKRFFNTTILDIEDLEIKDSSYGQL